MEVKDGRGHKLNLILLPLILNFIVNYSLILLLGIKNKLLALIIIKSHQQIEQAKMFDSNWTASIMHTWKEFVGNSNSINSWIIIENERSLTKESNLMWAMLCTYTCMDVVVVLQCCWWQWKGVKFRWVWIA